MARFARLVRLCGLVVVLALSCLLPGSAIVNAQGGTIIFRVVNIAPNDVLNIREFPTATSRIIGMIPPDGTGIQFFGERSGAWIFIRYANVEGWVHTRYVMPESGSAVSQGRVLD